MRTLFKVMGALGLVIVVVFATGIGKIVGKTTKERFLSGKREGELYSVLVATANNVNQHTPFMVDTATRLDSAAGFNKEFRYNYTLVNHVADDVNPARFVATSRTTIVNKTCTTEEMRIFFKNDVTVSFAYYGQNGKHIATILVQPSDCNSDRAGSGRVNTPV